MLSTTYISNFVTIAVVGSVAFSTLHAKDVSAATAILNPSFSANYQPARNIENSIHLELHTHTAGQPLSSLLQNMQQDKPLVHQRSLKKAYNLSDKKQYKLRDGKFGYCLPSEV